MKGIELIKTLCKISFSDEKIGQIFKIADLITVSVEDLGKICFVLDENKRIIKICFYSCTCSLPLKVRRNGKNKIFPLPGGKMKFSIEKEFGKNRNPKEKTKFEIRFFE